MGYRSRGHKESDVLEWLTLSLSLLYNSLRGSPLSLRQWDEHWSAIWHSWSMVLALPVTWYDHLPPWGLVLLICKKTCFQIKKKVKDTDLFLCWDGIDIQGIKGNNVNSYAKHELIIPREVWYTFTFTWAVIAVWGLLLSKEVKNNIFTLTSDFYIHKCEIILET